MTTTVKAGDVHPITWRVNADLTGVTGVELHVQTKGGDPITLPATVTNAATGEVEHALTGTLAPGLYALEVQITGPGSRVVTAPSEGVETLWVQDDIA